MIQLNRTFGNGTKPNKKQRGNRTDREALEPRQSTNAPIHHTTRANILIESCVSAGSEDDQASVEQAIKIAATKKAEPVRTLRANFARRNRHSKKIKATLMGRIRRM
jgi:hypothetical protein